MANKEEKNSKNVAGPFYVDGNCVGCGMCTELAGDFFTLEEVAYVAKQPATTKEIAQCKEAMDSCPVEAIGDDGEE